MAERYSPQAPARVIPRDKDRVHPDHWANGPELRRPSDGRPVQVPVHHDPRLWDNTVEPGGLVLLHMAAVDHARPGGTLPDGTHPVPKEPQESPHPWANRTPACASH